MVLTATLTIPWAMGRGTAHAASRCVKTNVHLSPLLSCAQHKCVRLQHVDTHHQRDAGGRALRHPVWRLGGFHRAGQHHPELHLCGQHHHYVVDGRRHGLFRSVSDNIAHSMYTAGCACVDVCAAERIGGTTEGGGGLGGERIGHLSPLARPRKEFTLLPTQASPTTHPSHNILALLAGNGLTSINYTYMEPGLYKLCVDGLDTVTSVASVETCTNATVRVPGDVGPVPEPVCLLVRDSEIVSLLDLERHMPMRTLTLGARERIGRLGRTISLDTVHDVCVSYQSPSLRAVAN